MREWLKKYDVWNRFLAVALSIVLWFVIMDRLNPDVTVPFNDVKVTLRGETDLLTSRSYSIIRQGEQTVDITLRGKRNVLMGLSKNDIEVIADVSQITGTGETQITCEVNTPDDSITVVDRNRLRITVVADKIDDKVLPLQLVLTGSPAEGFRKGEESIEPAEITVRGAQTEISRIAYARVTADITGREDSLEISAPISLIDHGGNVMNLQYTQALTDSVRLSVEINAVRDLPLRITFVPGGGLTEDHVEFSVLPSSVTVMGSRGILDEIEYLNLGTVDLDGIGDRTLHLEKAVVLPGGITSLSDRAAASVTVSVKNIEVRTIEITEVRLQGELPAGLQATWQDESLSVRLRGNRELLHTLTGADLEVSVDLSELEIDTPIPGTITAPVEVSVRNGWNVVVVGEYTIDLDIDNDTP